MRSAVTNFSRTLDERSRPQGARLYRGQVGAIDTSVSPNRYTVGGRKIPMVDTGEAIAVGDVVMFLVAGGEAVGLGKLIDT